ncbi:MAG: pyridoxamine 5'-phosphate oxidase family protein [Gammaproteobacteria bacterium]|jgi:predicted pyridoxine 5'-phosphate oxidase superfamily flavin-nucleotide-binding protein|nr:pyridoxamine 5'-phosphate oxidase family protein [Gammaproteobacteria bacterium]|tara:strand:- start:17023 stop:17403 length:381 start_codon:yes stop_codon:yes gene_type:complete
MSKPLPQEFIAAWENRQALMSLSTVDNNSQPNSIWLLCAELIDETRISIANNAMTKTLQNIEQGSHGALLIIAPERESYQIKGRLQHFSDGPFYDEMKTWLDPKFPGKGAVNLHIEEIYYGAEKVF